MRALRKRARYTPTVTGGTQVGPFTVSTTFPNSFTVTKLEFAHDGAPLAATHRELDRLGLRYGGDSDQHHHGVHDRTPIVLNCSIPASLGTYIPAAALSAISASASAQLEVTADINQGFAVSAESTTDPNTVIPLVGGGLVDFGGFGSYIAYVMTGVIVE